MCAGSRAWAGLTHEAILEAVRGPWQLAVPPGLPPVLQELMMSALSKDPKDRWVMDPCLCVCRHCCLLTASFILCSHCSLKALTLPSHAEVMSGSLQQRQVYLPPGC